MGQKVHMPTLDPKHPVLTQEYAVYTPAIDEMVSTLGDWIDQRITGGYIYGPSRYGKSRAVKWYVRAELEAKFGQRLPLVVWIRPGGRIQETEFWNQLVAASKFHFYNPIHQKRRPIARFLFKQQLITLARAARQNFVLLIIDEAHEISLTEWKWFLGIQNDLDNEGYRFSVFSIGSHQIAFQPDYMARTGNAHIAVRFFTSDARFHGVMNVEELNYILNGYDVDSEWPPKSCVSFLQYFSPVDFEQNRRLANHSENIWKAITEEFPPEFIQRNRKNPTGVPMRTVAYCAENLLRQLAEGKQWNDVLSIQNLKTIIVATGLHEHLRKISTIE
jgi:hypothetical protein